MILETIACVAAAKALVHDRIERYSREYDVPEAIVDYVVRNESSYDSCAVGDRHVREPSLGLAQINTHYNPDVSPEQALDPDFAVRYLASELADGKCSKWTTCRAYKKKNPSHPYFSRDWK